MTGQFDSSNHFFEITNLEPIGLNTICSIFNIKYLRAINMLILLYPQYGIYFLFLGLFSSGFASFMRPAAIASFSNLEIIG